MHEALRGWVRQHVSPTVADTIRILYGGALSRLTPGAHNAAADARGLGHATWAN